MHFRSALFLLLCLGVHSFASAVIIDRIAAIVDEDVITQSEVDAIEKLELHRSGLPDTGDALQDRINHYLVLNQIERQPPVKVAEEEIQQTVESFTREHGGNEEFLVFLNSIGMNYEDFYRELKEQLIIHEFISIRFRPFVNIQIDEAEAYYNEVFKPQLEREGKEVPSFAESFEQIQAQLASESVAKRTADWLAELRQESSVYVKQ